MNSVKRIFAFFLAILGPTSLIATSANAQVIEPRIIRRNMYNKRELLIALATLTLTQSVGFAQDSSIPNASAEIYEINGFGGMAGFGQAQISGSFTVKNSNNDELIDKSELSDFKLNLSYDGINILGPLSALNKFHLSADSQQYLRRFRQLGQPVPLKLLNLELNCQSKDAEFFLSNSVLRGKIKTRNNHSETVQNNDSRGMQITYSTGISHQSIEFEAPLYLAFIKSINQNIPPSQPTNIQASPNTTNTQQGFSTNANDLRQLPYHQDVNDSEFQ